MTNETNFYQTVHPIMNLFSDNNDLTDTNIPYNYLYGSTPDRISHHSDLMPVTNSIRIAPEPQPKAYYVYTTGGPPIRILHKDSQWLLCRSNDCCEIQMVKNEIPWPSYRENFLFVSIIVIAALLLVNIRYLKK